MVHSRVTQVKIMSEYASCFENIILYFQEQENMTVRHLISEVHISMEIFRLFSCSEETLTEPHVKSFQSNLYCNAPFLEEHFLYA
jgi:hypothetical protein